MKYYIGVDLGTSAVKLLLMDQEGQVVNIVSREYPLSFPHPGWSEQNPEDWWEQSKEGIRELISKIDAAEVAGISFGGQMHGLVILDEKDQVIRPAILWNDGRTTKETDYLNQVTFCRDRSTSTGVRISEKISRLTGISLYWPDAAICFTSSNDV